MGFVVSRGGDGIVVDGSAVSATTTEFQHRKKPFWNGLAWDQHLRFEPPGVMCES
jgi:hypothetical protein